MKPTFGAENSAAPQTDDTSMNVPMNSAPSSFVISRSSPFIGPLLRTAHHDIKPSPMTTLAGQILHTALPCSMASDASLQSDRIRLNLSPMKHLLPRAMRRANERGRHGSHVAPARIALDGAANDSSRSNRRI